jgi:hypothetical protein
MSTPAQETAFYDAINAAEGVRQSSKAAAQVKYGFVQSKYAQFITDLVAADTTYFTAVVAASNANGVDPQLAAPGPLQCARSGSKIGGN